MPLFHRTAALFIFIFLGLMILVTCTAFAKKSGNTGMDVSQMHLLRAKPQ